MWPDVSQAMRAIWRAYKADDPYAEWYLLNTYENIVDTLQKLKTYETSLQQQLESIPLCARGSETKFR